MLWVELVKMISSSKLNKWKCGISRDIDGDNSRLGLITCSLIKTALSHLDYHLSNRNLFINKLKSLL